ncbi:type II secretion system protein [Thalassotalea marina]|uniref:MSHA biogenesis protein MshB n=1 Tax=Thalassotalea marina TaxID=1673741 RepID=A0A919EHA5_9GAMM|nr:type II secretion system protein [Thalassotalea marina]GHF78323.1 MSHA biogenesis protein MshB [Thalassotalea marina]
MPAIKIKTSGFTLIELVVVIVILGILAATAAPKFLDVSDEAERAVFSGIAAAFRGGVEQVHLKWRIKGNGVAQLNFIPISDPSVGGDLSVNQFGYPADTRGTSLTMNSENDCLDVWRAVLISQDAIVAGNNSQDFEASYSGDTCTYVYNKQPTLTVVYNSTTGEIIIND